MFFIIVVLFFIILPILEIIVLCLLGLLIGWINAITLVFMPSFFAWFLFKNQLFNQSANFASLMKKGYMPHEILWANFLKLASSFLLIFPGLISEIMGILLMAPQVRHLLILCARIPFVQKFFGLNMSVVYQNENKESDYQKMSEMFQQNADGHLDDEYGADNSNYYGGRTVEFPEYPSVNRTSSSSEEDDDIIDVEYEIKTPHYRGQ